LQRSVGSFGEIDQIVHNIPDFNEMLLVHG